MTQIGERYERMRKNLEAIRRAMKALDEDMHFITLRAREQDGAMDLLRASLETSREENLELRARLETLESSPTDGDESGEREPAGGPSDDDD